MASGETIAAAGDIEVQSGGTFTVNGLFGISKTLTIESGATFRVESKGKVQKVSSSKIGGGTIIIKKGATYVKNGTVQEHTVKTNQ